MKPKNKLTCPGWAGGFNSYRKVSSHVSWISPIKKWDSRQLVREAYSRKMAIDDYAKMAEQLLFVFYVVFTMSLCAL